MIFLWNYLPNCTIYFVLFPASPPLITDIFFVFPFLSPHYKVNLDYSTAAPSEIGIITFHKGDNTIMQLRFRKCKTVHLCSLLIIYLSVFLGTWPKGESCQLPPGVIVTASDDVCPQVSCNLIIYRGTSKEKNLSSYDSHFWSWSLNSAPLSWCSALFTVINVYITKEPHKDYIWFWLLLHDNNVYKGQFIAQKAQAQQQTLQVCNSWVHHEPV